MNTFSRTTYSASAVTAEALAQAVPERVTADAQYAPYTDVDTGVPEYPATVTLAGMDEVLGSRITRLLMATDAEAALHVGAKVLASHATDSTVKKPHDLQVNLMVNVVKELAFNRTLSPGQEGKACEDILRRCSLEPDFKKKLKYELFDNQALITPFITVCSAEKS